MTVVEKQTLDEERALYGSKGIIINDCTFDGSFSEYCKFCFATGAGLYLIEASRIQDRGRQAAMVHEDNEGRIVLYGN